MCYGTVVMDFDCWFHCDHYHSVLWRTFLDDFPLGPPELVASFRACRLEKTAGRFQPAGQTQPVWVSDAVRPNAHLGRPWRNFNASMIAMMDYKKCHMRSEKV